VCDPVFLGRARYLVFGPMTPAKYGIDPIVEALRIIATRAGFDLDDPTTWPMGEQE